MGNVDIPTLRRNGKDPRFCRQVSTGFFDEVLELLLYNKSLNDSEIIDLIATISNILLINRELHHSYFIPKYSVQTIKFLDGFINSSVTIRDLPSTHDIGRLVPVYRLIFLILYNELDHIDAETIARIYSMLILGFEFCFSVFSTYKEDTTYHLAFTEILKGLYTFQHKHAYGEQVNKENRLINEGILYSCFVTMNNIVEEKEISSLLDSELMLTKYLLNSIMGLLTHDQCVNEFCIKNTEAEATFVKILLKLLRFQLGRFSHEKDIELTDMLNLFLIINYILNKLINQYDGSVSEDSQLRSIIKSEILPIEGDAFVFNKLISLILTSNNNIVTRNIQITDMKNFSNFKNLALECIYSLSWDPERDNREQMMRFLDFVGYLNAQIFISTNNLALLPDIDVDKMRFPNTKYLDNDTQKIVSELSKLTLDSLFNSTKDKKSNNSNLSMQEKELEAEKLFVLFDRMEKNGSFEGFKNPVREWQQLGKFEDLSDDT